MEQAVLIKRTYTKHWNWIGETSSVWR